VLIVLMCVALAAPGAWVVAAVAPSRKEDSSRPGIGEVAAVGVGLMAMFLVACWRLAGYGPVTVAAQLWLFLGLMALSIADLRTFRLPNRLMLITAGGSAVFLIMEVTVSGWWELAANALAGGAVCAGVLFAVHLVSPASLGFGDVKLAAVVGLDAGWVLGHGNMTRAATGSLAVLMVACLVGGVVGLVVSRGPREARSPIPFGPLLTLGLMVMVTFGVDALTV
jgi:leader peptidase (prepilin peptidase) / N-methyltransferase